MVGMNGVPRLSLVLAGLLIAGCGGGRASGKGGSGGGIIAGSSGGGIAGSSGGDTAGVGGGATAGSGGGVAGTTGSGGSVVSAEVKAAIEVCAWTTGCFNTEDSMGGAAPNSTLSGCLTSWENTNDYPWADAKACVAAGPTTCNAFLQCMFDRHVICPGSGETEWIKAPWCADGTRSCATTCTDFCVSNGAMCSDSTHLWVCNTNIGLSVVDCATRGYGVSGDTGTCNPSPFPGCAPTKPASTGSCGANSVACEGTVAVLCDRGLSYRLDCTTMGRACNPVLGCADGTQCTSERGACTGNTYQGCLSGFNIDVDCAALGGTCGVNRAGRPSCVFPEGTGGSGDAGG